MTSLTLAIEQVSEPFDVECNVMVPCFNKLIYNTINSIF